MQLNGVYKIENLDFPVIVRTEEWNLPISGWLVGEKQTHLPYNYTFDYWKEINEKHTSYVGYKYRRKLNIGVIQ